MIFNQRNNNRGNVNNKIGIAIGDAKLIADGEHEMSIEIETSVTPDAPLTLRKTVTPEQDKAMVTLTCAKCRCDFELSYDSYHDKPTTIRIESCESGGVYGLFIVCPHCEYAVDVHGN